jgi:hypothetical protein
VFLIWLPLNTFRSCDKGLVKSTRLERKRGLRGVEGSEHVGPGSNRFGGSKNRGLQFSGSTWLSFMLFLLTLEDL